jgi:glycosyltransferase A (GT-A) superfamily protein (DUF2064 family)
LVLAQTQARAKALGMPLSLLPEWRDVDTPDDLEYLRQQLAEGKIEARRTAKFLRRLAVKY